MSQLVAYLQEPEALRASEDPDDLVGDDVDDLDPGEAGEGDEVAALVEGHVVVLEQLSLLQLLLHRHLPVEVVQLLDLCREGRYQASRMSHSRNLQNNTLNCTTCTT